MSLKQGPRIFSFLQHLFIGGFYPYSGRGEEPVMDGVAVEIGDVCLGLGGVGGGVSVR